MQHPSPGLIALSGFFALGAALATTACVALLFPRIGSDSMWRLNPQAHEAFLEMGPWAVVLMLAVTAACAVSAIGLWTRASWGRQVAIALLVVNLIGDTGNAVIRRDWRTLIGLPIGGALIAYLLSAAVRNQFPRHPPHRDGRARD